MIEFCAATHLPMHLSRCAPAIVVIPGADVRHEHRQKFPRGRGVPVKFKKVFLKILGRDSSILEEFTSQTLEESFDFIDIY